jgi:hypothetical protein
MELTGPAETIASGSGLGIALDPSSIVGKLMNADEVDNLPRGTIVGDLCGGLTFSDTVAKALEARSTDGWQEIEAPNGEIWTIIVLNR